jgi:hypothetical protein
MDTRASEGIDVDVVEVRILLSAKNPRVGGRVLFDYVELDLGPNANLIERHFLSLQTTAFMTLRALETRISPETSFGSSASRRAERVRFSSIATRMR